MALPLIMKIYYRTWMMNVPIGDLCAFLDLTLHMHVNADKRRVAVKSLVLVGFCCQFLGLHKKASSTNAELYCKNEYW